MRKVRTHRFNGVKFDINLIGDDECLRMGECDSPRSGDFRPTISINVNLNTKLGVQTTLHECLHAEGWAVSEEVVRRVADEIGDLLWRLNFRMVNSKK